MERALRVHVSEPDADPERIAVLSGYLRTELLQLDVDDVTLIGAGEPPAGARGSGIAVADGLLVTIGHTAGSLLAVVQVIRQWLRRGDSDGLAVHLKFKDAEIELSRATEEQQDELIKLFISQYSKGDGG